MFQERHKKGKNVKMDWRPNATPLSSLPPSPCRKLWDSQDTCLLLPSLPGWPRRAAHRSPRIQKPWQQKQNVKLSKCLREGLGEGTPPPFSLSQEPPPVTSVESRQRRRPRIERRRRTEDFPEM